MAVIVPQKHELYISSQGYISFVPHSNLLVAGVNINTPLFYPNISDTGINHDTAMISYVPSCQVCE